MTRMKTMMKEKVWMPRWNFLCWYGGIFNWLKNDRIENNDEDKELGCLDDTPPDEMEENVSDLKKWQEWK